MIASQPTHSIVQTTAIKNALSMAESVMTSRPDSRAGQIIGDVGSGKTSAGWILQKAYNAVRVCAWAKISRKSLLLQIADQTDVSSIHGNSADVLTRKLLPFVAGRLIIIDEANHLTWDVIETLRIFIDEGMAGAIFIGTDLLERTFRSAQTKIYLEQMAQRIGTKRIQFENMTDVSQVAAYIITPRFGNVTEATAKAFLKNCNGNWRFALALADACDRIMRNENIEKLNREIVATAATWMKQNI